MKTLNVFVIHADNLTYRKKLIATTLKFLEERAVANGYTFNKQIITKYDAVDVRREFSEIEKIVKQSKLDDEDFDLRNYRLNIEKISNFLKQRSALELIAEAGGGDEHYYMVIEDDSIVLPDFSKNIDRFLINPHPDEWDILVLCMGHSDESVELKSTRDDIKILPSKEAYCIKPSTAKALLEDLQTLCQHFRLQLSAWIHKNTAVRSMYPIGRTSIEGSKIGLVPSTVNDNNILMYNKDFMTLFLMITGKEAIDIEKATVAFKSAENLRSADIIHLYGIILYKLDRIAEAKVHFESAVEVLIEKNGLLSKHSEILNNAINVNGFCQPDLSEYQQIPSKYA